MIVADFCWTKREADLVAHVIALRRSRIENLLIEIRIVVFALVIRVQNRLESESGDRRGRQEGEQFD